MPKATAIPGDMQARMVKRLLGRLPRRLSNKREVEGQDISRRDLFTFLLWLLAGVALAWAFASSFGNKEDAAALLPVIFAIVLVMINQVAAWQRDMVHRKHEEQVVSLLTEIRDELRKQGKADLTAENKLSDELL